MNKRTYGIVYSRYERGKEISNYVGKKLEGKIPLASYEYTDTAQHCSRTCAWYTREEKQRLDHICLKQQLRDMPTAYTTSFTVWYYFLETTLFVPKALFLFPFQVRILNKKATFF